MSFSLRITGKADMTEANEEIDRTSRKNAEATRAMAQQLRTVATMTVLTLTAFGGGVGLMYGLGIEAVAVALETIAAIRVAMAAATGGATALIDLGRAVVGIGAITALIIQMIRLKQGREEAARETGNIANLLKFGMYL